MLSSVMGLNFLSLLSGSTFAIHIYDLTSRASLEVGAIQAVQNRAAYKLTLCLKQMILMILEETF